MRKWLNLIGASACLIPAACATPRGGGALGFVLFDPRQHVAAAEPLFGAGDDKCLDDPTFLLTTFAYEHPGVTMPGPKNPQNPDICTRIRWALYWGLTSHNQSLINYDERARNEVVGTLVGASDRKCGAYVAYLQQYNANVKGGFGIIDTAASALATVASGGLNRALTVTSTLAGHTRSELEEAHFANQALGVLTQAFRKLRKDQRMAIETHLGEKVEGYTMSQGLADVFNYHASCSIVVGLEEAQKAVAKEPSSAAGENKDKKDDKGDKGNKDGKGDKGNKDGKGGKGGKGGEGGEGGEGGKD